MIIIKIGGGRDINLAGIAAGISELEGPVIIVHGANALRNELAEKLGSQIKTVTSASGYSSVFSDEQVIDLQMMAYAGLRNKRLVELLQQNGVNAVGLTGIDGAVIRGKRNAGIRVRENGKMKLLRDFSGKPKSINKELLDLLIKNNFVPVLTVPIIDENNTAINSENDDITALLNKTFSVQRVIHFIEADGLLEDSTDPDSAVAELSKTRLAQWEDRAEGRIKRKLHAIKKLFDDGAELVNICDGRTENPIADALNGKGTIIR